MPIYNPALPFIDTKETRRYAGLARAENFAEQRIIEACEDARLLATPRGCYEIYDYDCEKQMIAADPPTHIIGEKIGAHLQGCDKVIVLAVTVGPGIENESSACFQRGEYSHGQLLDAAATTAVEQLADSLEDLLRPRAAAQSYSMRWRFSPGYGDWPLEQQPELLRLTGAERIGVHLTDSLMLNPQKSVTAIIGLYHDTPQAASAPHTKAGCASCNKLDCPSRQV